MRLVRYAYGGRVGVGVKLDGGVAPTPFGDMIELIRAGEAGLEAARAGAESGPVFRHYRTLAPLPSPGKILFSGINYASHKEENPSATLPQTPHFFAKLPSSVIGPEEPVVIPGPETQVDYEVELAVVIGRATRGVSEDRALDHVFGYTVVNDVSARDIQFADNQITTGKGYDTFCPMGPEVVLRDEIPDPSALHVVSRVNGEERQSSPTSDMLFSVPQLLAFLSVRITLYPGDVVSTGTPAGVGTFRDPPAYLKPGDVTEVEVDRIGRLRNPVVAGW
jgi:2-keto-4-pentenoate hydratase/2-oxohepta-3-ene-1,7-dioic acid hydratase in catechol pathway